MSQFHSVIVDWDISIPGHGKEVVDGINAVDKRYIYQLVSNVQISGSNIFDFQMQINTGNQKNDVSLSKEFQQHLTEVYFKNGAIDQVKKINNSWKNIYRQTVTCLG